MRVLIADDEPVTRLQLSRILDSWGYETVQASNGDEAWEILQREKIRLLISDFAMPGCDGPALCRRVRESGLPWYTYVILLTSQSGKGAIVEALKAGADDFVAQPFHAEELNLRIRAGERVLRLEADLEERNWRLVKAYDAANRDLQAAAAMQKSLLPDGDTVVPALRFASLFAPSGWVAGDIFDIFALDHRRSGFYVLDVAGHGVASAMLSFMLSKTLSPSSGQESIVRRSVPQPPFFDVVDPSVVVAELNGRFQDADDAMRYFTMIYGIHEPDRDRLRLVQAGHPPPIVQTDAATRLAGESGYPVGMLPGLEFEETFIRFEHGDRLFVYSDGVSECACEAGEQFGTERLVETIEGTRDMTLEEAVAATGQALKEWNSGEEYGDDVTLLAIERLG